MRRDKESEHPGTEAAKNNCGTIHIGEYSVSNAVAIQNYLISGSFFVQSLLDNHPQILTVPHLYGPYIYYFWPKILDLDCESRAKVFVDHHKDWFQADKAEIKSLGENQDEVAVIDPDQFTKELIRLTDSDSPIDRRTFHCAVFIAYALALGRELYKKNLILISPLHSTTLERADEFAKDFPNALYLYTYRHPATNFTAGVRHMVNYAYNYQKHNIIHAAFTQLFLDRAPQIGGYQVFGDRPYRNELRDRCRAIRLEDLHRFPEPVMRSLAEWIGIDWRPSLLQSTLNGKLWWNTRPKPPNWSEKDYATYKINGFDPDQPWREWNTKLNLIDKFRLNEIARRKYCALGYENRAFAPWLRRLRYQTAMVLLWVPFVLERQIPLGKKRTARNLAKHAVIGRIIRKLRPLNIRMWLAGLLLRLSDYRETRDCLKHVAEIIRLEGDIEVDILEFEKPKNV